MRRWEDEGVWLEGWQQLLAALNHQQLLEWDETFMDGSFVSAKKGALLWEKPSAGRRQSGCTGRWPRHSFGSATGECFTGRSHARRIDGGSGPSPVLGTGSAAAETETHNCRSCLRLEPAAGSAPEAWYRVVGAASAKPAALVEAGRKKATSVQEKMESRAHAPTSARRPMVAIQSRLKTLRRSRQ